MWGQGMPNTGMNNVGCPWQTRLVPVGLLSSTKHPHRGLPNTGMPNACRAACLVAGTPNVSYPSSAGVPSTLVIRMLFAHPHHHVMLYYLNLLLAHTNTHLGHAIYSIFIVLFFKQ